MTRLVLISAALLTAVSMMAGRLSRGGVDFLAALGEPDPSRRYGALLKLVENGRYPDELALIYLTRLDPPPVMAPRLAALVRRRPGELIPALLMLRCPGAGTENLMELVLPAWKVAMRREGASFDRRLLREFSGRVVDAGMESGDYETLRQELEALVRRYPHDWQRMLPPVTLLEFYSRYAFVAGGFELPAAEWEQSEQPGRRAFLRLLRELRGYIPDTGEEAERLIKFYLRIGERRLALETAVGFMRRERSPATLGLLVFTAAEGGIPEVVDNLQKFINPALVAPTRVTAHLRAGNFDEAKKLLPLVSDPARRAALELELLSAQGRHREAAELALASSAAPEEIRILFLLLAAEALGEEKYYREAEKLADEKTMRDASLANAFGYVALELGLDPEPAERKIRFALSLEPRNSAFLDSMARARFRAGDFNGAWKWMEKALRLVRPEPESCEILENAGDIQRALKESTRAREFYRKALELARVGVRISAGADFRRRVKRISDKLAEELK